MVRKVQLSGPIPIRQPRELVQNARLRGPSDVDHPLRRSANMLVEATTMHVAAPGEMQPPRTHTAFGAA
jgi:hypothetical protein